VTDIGRTSASVTISLPGAQAVVPAAPVFNISSSTQKKLSTDSAKPQVTAEKPKPQVTEVDVPVTAEVPAQKESLGAKLSSLFKGASVNLSPNSWLVKGGIVLAIVVLGLLGFALSRSYYA